MKAVIWGARGSLPVALTHKQIRAKLVAALEGAIGRNLDTGDKIADYVDNELAFDVRGTFGGHSSCVEVQPWDPATTTEHVILDMGSGLRPLGGAKLARYGPSWGSRSSPPRISPATASSFMAAMNIWKPPSGASRSRSASPSGSTSWAPA
jgi:hypothetical protein